MLGNNVLVVNNATLCEMIQHYLDSRTYKDQSFGRVIYVDPELGDEKFNIHLKVDATTEKSK